MTMDRTSSTSRERTLLTVLGAAAAAAGLALIPIVHAEWGVCWQAQRFDDGACLHRQTDFDYSAVLTVWNIAAVGALVGVIVALVRRRRRREFAIALGFVLLGNVLTDYVLAPTLNGGYSSHDSAPGMGFWAAGCIVAAGATLLLGAAVRRPVST